MVSVSRFVGSGLRLLAIVVCLVKFAAASEPATFTPEQIEFFETHVRPLLVAHCYDCHSTDAKELKAELYVDSRAGLLKGGESGPAIVPGKASSSELIAAIRYESTEMPPNRKLSAKDIDALTQWVEMGAPWPQVTSSPGLAAEEAEIDWQRARESHWAWQPVQRPPVPPIQANSTDPFTNPIDCFLAERRHEAGITANGPASAAVLARRIYVDLLGYVPTPDQIDRFVAAAQHDRVAAIEKLVDTLLQSPMYGQRWGRYWLDVARYSDGYGGFLDNAGLDQAWRYRDWVVEAFNDDMPINRFLEL